MQKYHLTVIKVNCAIMGCIISIFPAFFAIRVLRLNSQSTSVSKPGPWKSQDQIEVGEHYFPSGIRVKLPELCGKILIVANTHALVHLSESTGKMQCWVITAV